MFLRRMKHKAKLLSSSGSLQHIEDECRGAGNVENWAGIGFWNVEDLQVLVTSIRGQVDRELEDWNDDQ
ncbi:hypothetical protein NC651_040338 [Populus alba x Populus x berolinensis]|nr:hypothetical protein NC651_040338 [Populus alba x Populus x berolinensis]